MRYTKRWMSLRKKFRSLKFILKLWWNNEPIKIWRKADDGKYICDGDCKRYSAHGVCTCGLCHHFKMQDGGLDNIHRETTSWRREYQTEQVMMKESRLSDYCEHGKHWDDEGECPDCRREINVFIEDFFK